MAQLHKCPLCGNLIKNNEIGPVKYKSVNRYMHKQCYQSYVKGISDKKTKASKEKEEKPKRGRKPKPQAELKDAVSEEEYAEKKSFYGYLRDSLGVEPNAKIYSQVNRFCSQFGLDFGGMEQTLKYLNEVLQKPLTGDVVGLIPYYYDEAKRWYENLKKIEDRNTDMAPEYREKVITIQRPTKNKRKEIDF